MDTAGCITRYIRLGNEGGGTENHALYVML